MHRVEAGENGRDDGVAGFVIGDDPALLVAHDPLLLEPGDHAIDRLVEVLHLDRRLVAPRRQQRRLVDQIGEIGAGKAGRARGDDPEVDVLRGLDLAHVDLEDLFAAAHVRLVDEHLPVEPPGPHQRRIEHFGPVGGRHDDDPLAGVEAVHLGQELIEGLLALLVTPHRRLDADLAERVELVDEDDAGCLVLRLAEEIAHARRADADEHLDELGTAQAEERDVGLARDRAREERLAGPRRPDEQHALGNPAADARVLLRVLQELDDLAQLFLGLIHAGDVGELHLDVVFGGIDLGPAARERHHAALGSAQAAEEEAPQHDQEEHEDAPAEQLAHQRVGDLAAVLHAVLLEILDELGIVDADGEKAPALGALGFHLALDPVGRDRDFLDLALADARLELAVGNRLTGLQRRRTGGCRLRGGAAPRARTTWSCPAPAAAVAAVRAGSARRLGCLQTSELDSTSVRSGPTSRRG